SDESVDDLDLDKKGRKWSKTKKRRSFRHEDSGSERDDADRTGLVEEAVHVSAPISESSSKSLSPSLMEENAKTALCAPSMVISSRELPRGGKEKLIIIVIENFKESMMPEDDDNVDDVKPPVNYQAIYEGASESKYTNMELSVELRYWIVLALFICLLIIYRSLLPSVQCDTKFQ
uniref:DUF3402 domain-containing protein n=1 Tax=Elaeophora elaphi TaxID=1147741 RepID=A0A0R3RP40_9BILA